MNIQKVPIQVILHLISDSDNSFIYCSCLLFGFPTLFKLFVNLLFPDTPQITNKIINFSRYDFIFYCIIFQASRLALYLYDSMWLYLLILNETLHRGLDHRNGSLIFELSKNRAFEGKIVAFSNQRNQIKWQTL